MFARIYDELHLVPLACFRIDVIGCKYPLLFCLGFNAHKSAALPLRNVLYLTWASLRERYNSVQCASSHCRRGRTDRIEDYRLDGPSIKHGDVI